MGRRFQPARNGKTVPQVQSLRYTTGQVFLYGALVVDSAAGEVVECGADPASILGVSLQDAGSGLGFGYANSAQTVAPPAQAAFGPHQEVSVAVADRDTQFSGRGVNGGTDPVLPLQTHIGEQYGVSKVGSDWVIDFAKTAGSARVEITDIRPEDNAFLFKVLEANLARP